MFNSQHYGSTSRNKSQIKMQLDADYMLNRKLVIYCLIGYHIVPINRSHVSAGDCVSGEDKNDGNSANVERWLGECLIRWTRHQKCHQQQAERLLNLVDQVTSSPSVVR